MTHPTHAELVEAMARAIHEGRNGPGTAWLSRAKAYRQPYLTDADRALATLCTLIPGLPALLDGTARVVPVEATSHMALSAMDRPPEVATNERLPWQLYADIYRAMISASPYATPEPTP